MTKKLEQIFTDLSSKTKKTKRKITYFKYIFNKNFIIIFMFGLSIYFYYEPLNVIYLEYLHNNSILTSIFSIYNLYFSVNSFYKLFFLFVLYLII